MGPAAQGSGDNGDDGIGKYGPLFSAGLELAVAVGVMCLVGYLLDRHFGTTPWLMVTGIFFGAVAGFYLFVKTISSVDDDTKPGRGGPHA